MNSIDRAQSTVIGVILLTAVVILTVSTIGVFFLGTISEQADASRPLVDVDISMTNETIEVRHVAGDSVDLDDLTLLLTKGSSTERYAFDDANVTGDGDGEFDPTETFARNHSLGSGAFRVRIVDEGSNSLLHSERVDAYAEDDRDGDDSTGESDPAATFIAIPDAPTVGEPVTFDARGSSASDGTITSYEWEFGDGTEDDGPVVGNRYSSSGTYTVTLSVTDDDGRTATHSRTIQVEEWPVLRWADSDDWDGASRENGVAHQSFGDRDPDTIQLGYPATEDDLVGYWPLDETDGETTIGDVSGTGNDGTTSGGPLLSTAGIFDTSGVGLDGQDDYVSVPDDPSLERSSDDAVSVSAWVYKSSGQSGWVAITQKSDQSYNLQLTNGNEPTFTIYDGDWNEANAGVSLQTGQWYHLAGTYDGDTAQIYVDGELKGSTSGIGQMGDASGTDLGIGENPGSNGRHLNGRIDEVRIYDRSIAPTRVDRLANAIAGNYVSEPRTASESMNVSRLSIDGVEATLGSGSATVVVESDPDDDGNWEERTDPIELVDGENSYDVAGLSTDATTFRLRVRMTAVASTESPVLSNVSITEDVSSRQAPFAVTSLDAPDSVTTGDTYTVTADIENTGSVADTQLIEYRLGGSVVDSTDVTIPAGETTMVELQHTVQNNHSGGTVDHGVYSPDDSATGSIDVEVAPAIDQFEVSDDSVCYFEWSDCAWGDESYYTVTWSVSDANANLDSATIQLRNSSGQVVVDAEPTAVGQSASGETTLSESGGYDSDYTIEIDVTDQTGLDRSSAVNDTADGTDP